MLLIEKRDSSKNQTNMTELTAFIIIAFSALIHASFQLSISMLTLLSSHTIGRKRSARRLFALTSAFSLGVTLMTMLLLSLFALVVNTFIAASGEVLLIWTIGCGLLTGVGVAVWAFYYRRQLGTSLWIPRGFARFLSGRTKRTRQSSEAFTLGLGSVIAELLFIIAPLSIAAIALTHLSVGSQLLGIGLYGLLSLSPLLYITLSINGGASISRIQKWREANKGFLQFAAGSGLVALGFYIYVEEVITQSVMAAAGSL